MIMTVLELADRFCGFSAVVDGACFCAVEASPRMLALLNGIVIAATFSAGRGILTGVVSVLIYYSTAFAPPICSAATWR